MAQAPASPKLKRAALRAATRIVGPKFAMNGQGCLPSERAALALRATKAKHRPAEQVVFLIPLVSRDHVNDWDAVCARLQETLNSLVTQDCPDWIAIICCQDVPEIEWSDQIRHLPFSDPTPGNDKWRKLATLYDHLPQFVKTPSYVMSFDADDIAHPGMVAEMLCRQAHGGYLVREGYVLNAGTGDIGLAGARSIAKPMRKPFWKLCGSCAAVFHDPDTKESLSFLRLMTQHEHRMFPYLARLAGRALTPLSRPSVLYVLNHGENFGARRGRVSFKQRFVERYKITDPQDIKQIKHDFGLET